jgi:hypothetical protein
MADGVRYSAVWGLDGEIQADISYVDELWSGGESGAWWVCATNDNGVPAGMWDLELSVEDSLITGSFVGLGDDLRPFTVTVSNDGPETICFLQISPSTSTFWGADWLGSDETIAPDDGVTLSLPPYTYDLRGLDCDVEEIFTDQQTISADTELIY